MGHVQPDFANHYAQVMVREGVHVAFLQRIARLLAVADEGEAIFLIADVVEEWEGWFRRG